MYLLEAHTKVLVVRTHTLCFHGELTKIINHLSQNTHLLLFYPSYFCTEILTEPTTKNNNDEVDASDLKQLMDMGFTENRARKALLLNRLEK